jgi:hypothetical protein
MMLVLSTMTICMVLNMAMQKYLNTWLGNEPDASGMPRFRLASGLFTQLFCLPVLLCFSVISYGSFSTWVEKAENPWDCLWPSVFSSVFAAFMLSDMLLLRLSTTMMLHHIACLLSVFACFWVYPEGFPYYTLGVVIMETGSAAFNITLLGSSDLIYLVLMPLSNVLSGVVFYLWTSSQSGWSGIIFASVLYIPIVFMRQRAAYLRMLSAKSAPSLGRA